MTARLNPTRRPARAKFMKTPDVHFLSLVPVKVLIELFGSA